MASRSTAGGGISFAGLLTIAFIALKLTHQIRWSWFWVVTPLWFGATWAAGWLLAGLTVAAVVTLRKRSR